MRYHKPTGAYRLYWPMPANCILDQLDGGSIQKEDRSSYGGKVITNDGDVATLRFTLYDDDVVTNANRSIPFLATGSLRLTLDSAGVITGGFGNTARPQVLLPDGLRCTSQSGVFLIAP